MKQGDYIHKIACQEYYMIMYISNPSGHLSPFWPLDLRLSDYGKHRRKQGHTDIILNISLVWNHTFAQTLSQITGTLINKM